MARVGNPRALPFSPPLNIITPVSLSVCPIHVEPRWAARASGVLLGKKARGRVGAPANPLTRLSPRWAALCLARLGRLGCAIGTLASAQRRWRQIGGGVPRRIPRGGPGAFAAILAPKCLACKLHSSHWCGLWVCPVVEAPPGALPQWLLSVLCMCNQAGSCYLPIRQGPCLLPAH